jgi:hypothetical protein
MPNQTLLATIAPPMLNPTTPDRTPSLHFLEQLYELNNTDALAAFLSDPQPTASIKKYVRFP